MYIRQDKLSRLREYKYSGVDKSLISRYVLKPFYTNVVIHLFPRAMAPNLITLLGFVFIIINFFTLLFYCPTLNVDCPSWVYISWGIGLFLYQTFDAVDGLQARRTNQSGPLGELFDHGVDALNTSLGSLIFCASVNLGLSWRTLLILFTTQLTFYIQTWEEYYTHTLTLGVVSGPVEGLLIICLIFFWTAYIGGSHFWSEPALLYLGIHHQSVPFIPQIIYDFAWNEWIMVYGGIVLVFNIFQAAYNVLRARLSQKKPVISAFVGLLPFFFTWLLVPIFLYIHPYIFRNQQITLMLYLGVVNAYSVGRIIVAHITKSTFPNTILLTIPLAIAVIEGLISTSLAVSGFKSEHFTFQVSPLPKNFPPAYSTLLANPENQVAFLYMSLGLAVGIYSSFVVDIILNICEYLSIWCLSIKSPINQESFTARKDK